MRILILLVTVCTLSSCGLFRKSSKQVLDVRKSAEIERVEDRKDTSHTQTSSSKQTTTHTSAEGSHTTEIEADEVIIGVDGSISAKGNVRAKTEGKGSYEEDKQENEQADKSVSTSTETKIKEVSKESERVKDIDKKSEPVKVNWIAFTLFVGLIAGVGYAMWLGRG